jgi:hypothetical protein
VCWSDPRWLAAFRAFPAESLDLRAMAAAQYANTDHDTDYGRLIQGQVDHTLFPGRRVRTTAADLETMAADFRENFGGVAETTRFLLGTCPACQRDVTHGDFGVDHIFYYLEGDEDKKPVKVRSIPRIWRGPCAEKRAKQMRKPRVKSRTEKALADEWTSFVNDVNREQGHAVVEEEEAAATPANAATASLWAWLAEALVGAAGAEGKVSFEVTRVDPLAGSDVDARRGAFAVRLRVSYRATTALVTGEPVDAAGSSVVSLSLEPGGAAVAMATEPGGAVRARVGAAGRRRRPRPVPPQGRPRGQGLGEEGRRGRGLRAPGGHARGGAPLRGRRVNKGGRNSCVFRGAPQAREAQ